MSRSGRDVAILTAVFALIALWLLHRPPVWAHGEAREGLVVQDIVRHGHWVLPRRNGALPSKPPLFHWMAAGLAQGLGLSDATLRLPSAIAAWAMLAITFLLGVRCGGRLTGWLAVGVLAGTETFWTSASEARTDMLFSACVAGALGAFLLWTLDGRRRARAACYAAATLAVLAKGPAGALLPGIVIVGFLAAQRRVDRLRALWSWPLVGAAVLAVVGWYAAAYRAGGQEFLATQLLHENIDRFIGHGEFGRWRGRSPLRMELALMTEVLPWSLVLPWAFVRRWRGAREDEGGRFLHAWWIGILVFFTLAAGKRTVYLLPLYPAVALLAARALAGAVQGERLLGLVPAVLRRRWPAHAALALLVACMVTFDAVVLVTNQVLREQRERRKSLVPFVREVAALVPPGQALRASSTLPGTELQVFAYRLDRSIPRRAVRCERGGFYLMPQEAAERFGHVVAVSHRKGEQMALVACPPRAPRRGGGADSRS